MALPLSCWLRERTALSSSAIRADRVDTYSSLQFSPSPCCQRRTCPLALAWSVSACPLEGSSWPINPATNTRRYIVCPRSDRQSASGQPEDATRQRNPH